MTAATPELPPKLLEQLVDGGRMIVPIGEQFNTQQLCLVTRQGNQFETSLLEPVLFVPLLPDISEE